MNNNGSVSKELVEKYRKQADELYEAELLAFDNGDSQGMSQEDSKWMEDTMRRGTLQDRIAAMTVMCNQNPVHKLHVLDKLLVLAGKEKRVATMSGEALQNLFTSVYLPQKRKLISLSRRPLETYEQKSSNKTKSRKTLSPRVLLLWRFEELVRERYTKFLALIHGWLNDAAGLDMNKQLAIRMTVELLSERPEAEAQLLSMAVNKIGDPTKKVAAAAGHQLRLLLERHPFMTPIVAREVQQLAHRPHLSPKALYNCIIFLNQLKLTSSDDSKVEDSLPVSLIKTYFRLFEVAIQSGKSKDEDRQSRKQKKSSEKIQTEAMMGRIRGRLLSALLTGVNRAQPYLPQSDEGLPMEHIDSLYRISHTSPPAAATQALMLLFQFSVGSSDEEDSNKGKNTNKSKGTVEAIAARKSRFYRALYSKVSDPAMFVGRHMTMFFNLLYRAMKADNKETRVLVFAKSMLQTASHASPGVAAGSLFLISEVMKVHPKLKESESQNILTCFDLSKRDPDAALGESKTGSLWEASLLSCHFHPSVAKFSKSLSEISYKGDPCKDFSLGPFLDRFAYRNPKSKERLKKQFKLGESVAERKSGGRGLKAAAAVPVNDPKFLQSKNISEMDNFYHKFFAERTKRDTWKGVVRNSTDMQEKEADYGSDSDPEEAEFAHQLAEKMMEDAGNRAHYDDEDPDMTGWNDMKDESDYEEPNHEADFAAMDGIGLNNADDDDGFMDDESSDEDNFEGVDEKDDEIDDGFDNAMINGDCSSDEDNDNEPPSRKKKRKKSANVESSFADAADYEAMINASWKERDQSKKMEDDEFPKEKVKKSKSKKRRQK